MEALDERNVVAMKKVQAKEETKLMLYLKEKMEAKKILKFYLRSLHLLHNET